MANRDITIDLNVDQQGAQRGLQKSNKQFKGYNKNVNKAQSSTRGFSSSLSSVGGVLTGLGIGIAADQLISFASEAINAQVETQRWADRLGIAVEDLQELQFAAKEYGVTNDALIDGLKELSLRADEFAQVGSGPAAEAFERLGFNQAEINAAKDDTEALFQMVQNRMSNVQSQAARQRIADELFGGQGGEQFTDMLQASQSEMRNLRNEAQETGAVVSEETSRQLEDLSVSWDQAWSSIKGNFLTASVFLIDILNEVHSFMVDALTPPANLIEDAFYTTTAGIGNALEAVGVDLDTANQKLKETTGLAEDQSEELNEIGKKFGNVGKVSDNFLDNYILDLDTSNQKEEEKKKNLQLISDEFNTNAENLDLLRQKQQQLSQLQNLPWSKQSVGQIRALKQEINELQEKTTNWARDFQRAQQRDVQQVESQGTQQLDTGGSEQERKNAALQHTVQLTDEVRQAQNAATKDFIKGSKKEKQAEERRQEMLGRTIAMDIQRANSAQEAANNIIDTVISEIVAYAIRSVFESPIPFPANIALAAGAAAAGKGMRSLIPEFAEGVTNFQGGNAIVGERGPEMVNLPRGSNVITNENVEKMERQGPPAQGGNMRDAMVDALSQVNWDTETRVEGEQFVQVARKSLKSEKKLGGKGTL